jgi:hypothetical protein
MNRHEGRRFMTTRPSAKAAPTALDMFWVCCEARAHLYAVGERDMHDAVDVLQEHAVGHGLVAEIGQDAVQAIICRGIPPRVREEAGHHDRLKKQKPTVCSLGAIVRIHERSRLALSRSDLFARHGSRGCSARELAPPP